MPLIKRYPNRKLYDTEAKRYVTLEDIAGLIRGGEEVRVVDHESGDDVTSLTLTQIILEQEKKTSGYLSSSLLTGIIRSGGSTLEAWRKSLQQGVSNLGGLSRLSSSGVEEQVNRLIGQGKLNMEQAQGLVRLDGLLTELLHSLNMPTQQDLQALHEQIETLNERLKELSESSAGLRETGASVDADAPGESSDGRQAAGDVAGEDRAAGSEAVDEAHAKKRMEPRA